MKNGRNFHQILLMFLVIGFLESCISTIPVQISDYKSSQGGEHIEINIKKSEITSDGQTIKGVHGRGTTTALVYKDENSKFITDYSSVNSFYIYHEEDWGIKKNYKKLIINRAFYKNNDSIALKIFQVLLTIPTFGYIWMMPTEFYSKQLFIPDPDSPREIAKRMAQNISITTMMKPINLPTEPGSLNLYGYNSIMLTIRNTGDTKYTDEFNVVESLPDFLEFQDAEFYSNGDVKEVIYDLKNKDKHQVIPFKVVLEKNGLAPGEYVQIKINFKASYDKLKKSNLNHREILHVGELY